jgi:asparagine synthase (glutamine-hydrolysing)
MGGFAVIFNLDGRPADRAIFERMLAAIAHRGPDGCGRWIDGPLAIGCQMFHTTPEAVREVQPLSDPDGRYCLAFDGRVDNRQELAALLAPALRDRDTALRDDTDAELVLRAYQCFGAEAPLRIIGDFAVVVWDGARRELFCARDPIGIRPFYYFCNGRTFIAATELQQIFADPTVPSDPDEGTIGEYLSGTLTRREDTLYRHVKRLPAAHSMTVGAGSPTVRAYFDLDPHRRLRYRDDREYADHFREIFAEAVRCRMRAIGGVGAHLSGGLDSTSVVGMAHHLRREGKVADAPFETFSLLFDHPDLDERAYIFETVKQLGLTANYPAPMPVDLAMCAEAVRRYRDFTEYPNGGMWNGVWPAARDKGLRVLLSGTGSDEWMSGSAYVYADLLRAGDLRTLWRRVHRDSRTLPNLQRRGAAEFFLRYAVWPLLPGVVRKFGRRWRSSPIVPKFIDPALARRIGLSDRLQSEPHRPAGMSFGQFTLRESFTSGWVAHGVDIFDRSTARFGVEERHPFHDRRLYEFLMAIPDDQRARDFERKFIMRNAMRGLVPDSVLARRDKADFSILFIQALERVGGERFFDSMGLEAAGWVDRAEFQRMYRHRCENYLDTNIWPLWTTFALELWYRLTMLRQDAPQPQSRPPVAPTRVATG